MLFYYLCITIYLSHIFMSDNKPKKQNEDSNSKPKQVSNVTWDKNHTNKSNEQRQTTGTGPREKLDKK